MFVVPDEVTTSSLSKEMLDCFSNNIKSPQQDSRNQKNRSLSPPAGTSFQVFRNNTTAVEVVVKELQNRHPKRSRASTDSENNKITRLQQQVQDLKIELNNVNTRSAFTKKGLGALVLELKKQLDRISKQEIEEQSENIALRLENEKLKALLESKSRVIDKLKKEIVGMKRIMKCIAKSLRHAPQMKEACTLATDLDYEEFEKDLKQDAQVRFAYDAMGSTFDSSVSKNGTHSFDK